ncbi:3-methylmercaptopropionyl-CoA dehydrogenase [Rhodovastum atsumiense]|uniref:Acyl-CoA dehydrogenase n=1 Tax=Rhodovastum atsumiense TaxID=504468 RepID=A0A5M6IW08_9PROT|nr:acyl-CoA dehydrogenase family protein [Rhodovastum atsumiense]KAA5612129.1 acyl-CoA dehydrogenase [Rhodovastum atsumiense]CAH2603929.1 3-methylmercaptopropionyl-CoA dehydrogenase [Rhodovastum atsumiense]
MIPFRAPVDDILFSLEHVARADRLPDWDAALVREVIGQFGRFAETAIAPLDAVGDAQGCRLDQGRVRLPDGFAETYRAYTEQGWPGLALPEAHGGQGMSEPVLAAVSEIFSGACHALQMVAALVPGAARTLLGFGTPQQQALWLPRLASGTWLATMALTEPGAGSDLGAIRTRAVPDGDGWRISGEKIFISGGDQDLSEGILHLVLARTGVPGEGTRGLSLFLVPSQDESGQRAPVTVARLEEKMGLHASPTCQLVFEGAPAELVGAPGEGLRAMFTMMNHARLDVALQGVAHAARAGAIATAYAAERRQGRDAQSGAPLAIAAHEDVRRMLETAEALALGGRALCHLAAVALARGDAPDLVGFLTPVCKVFCTEAGVTAADLGIQVLGGYGYLSEYRVEQTLRDARVTMIYEGTNGIHALALVTRQLRGGGPEAFEAFVAASGGGEDLAEGLALWRAARARVLASSCPAALAHPFMQLTAGLAYLAAWQRIIAVADRSSDPTRLERAAARVRGSVPVALRGWAALVT